MKDLTVQSIRSYHAQFNPDGEIVKICDAIIDAETGLGILALTADFPSWFQALEDCPDVWVIGQHRDFLKHYLDQKENPHG